MRQLVRQHPRFFALVALAALGLRLFFLWKTPHVTEDSIFYADIAKNWLLHGLYARSYDPHQILPTYSRLPGYPAFLAFVFAIFGIDNFTAVLIIQVLVDVATCFVIADLTRRCISDRAAQAAFVLAALCPFLAQYAAAALTETLEIFFTALAMDFTAIGLNELASRQLRPWIGCGAAIAACILLRPDGGLLLLSVGAYLGILLLRALRRRDSVLPLIHAGLVVAAVAMAPLVVWGVRNHRIMHRWQFLAPRYANEPDEFVPLGFNRWVNTWIADYTSTEEIYWNVPGAAIDANNLPSRAFDTSQQRESTVKLVDNYNQALNVAPELDARFAALAAERIHSHPLRYYLVLPALKIADMWLRPRTEILPPDTRWYEFDDDKKWIALSLGFGVLNFLYLLAAAAGLVRTGPIAWAGLGLSYILLRSLFLATMPNPEPRYTLECYPIVILLAAATCARLVNGTPQRNTTQLQPETRSH